MADIHVEFDLRPADVTAAGMFSYRQGGGIRRVMWTRGLIGCIWVGIAMAGVWAWVTRPLPEMNAWLVVVMLGFGTAWVYFVSSMMFTVQLHQGLSQAANVERYAKFYGRYVVRLTDDGILSESRAGVGQSTWESVIDIVPGDKHAFLCVGFAIYPIPARAFATQAEFDAFVEAARGRIGQNTPGG